MIKKIVASIIAFTMVFTCVSSVFGAESFINRFIDDVFISSENSGETVEVVVPANQQYDILQKLLFELNILDSGKGLNLKAQASYDDFINAAASILGILDITSTTEERFEYLKNNHVLISETKPQYISMKELINAAVELTGWGEVYRPKGVDAFSVALDKKLIHNVNYHEGNATNAEMAQVLFNILSVESITVSGVSEEGLIFDTTDVKTILERNYNTELYRGVITAAGITGIYANTDLEDNEVEIDGVKYDSISDLSPYAGMNVTAFISHSNNYNEPTVLVAEPFRNTTVQFSKSDIEGYTSDKITYKNEKSRNVALRVNESTKIICNNVFYASYNKATFEGVLEGDSEFIWIDNDSDNIADVLCVWEYHHFPTLHTVGKIGRITFKYDMLFRGLNYIDTENTDDVTVVVVELDNAGEEVEILATDIKQNEIVSIAASKNTHGKKYVKVILSSNTITDKFVAIGEDATVWETEGGTDYLLAEDYSDACGLTDSKIRADVVTPVLGETYKMFTSFNGKIADITTSEELPWAVLVNCGTTGTSLNKSASAKIFDGKYMQIYDFADKVNYYDENSLDGEKINPVKVVERIKALNPADPRCLIRYELNAEKKITAIYMPVDRSSDDRPGQLDYPNVIAFNGSGRFYGSMIDTTYSVNPSYSVLYNIPSIENASIDEEYYTSGFNKQVEYTIDGLKLHDVDKYYICPVGITVGATKDISEDLPTGVVDKIIFTTNEQKVDVCRVFCYLSGPSSNPNQGSYSNIDFELDEISTTESYYPSEIPVTELKFGDVIQVDKSTTGLVNGFRVLLRMDESVNDFCVRDKAGAKIEGEVGYMQPSRMTYLGEYLGSKDDMILVDVDETDEERVLPVRYFAYNYIMLVDREEKTATVINRADISVGDTIFAVRRYAGITVLVVIR